MSLVLGTEEKTGFDEKGYEHRWLLAAIAECPICGKEVAMWSQTECWVHHRKDNRWHHEEYDACPTGECCGNTIIHNGLDGKTMILRGDAHESGVDN